MAPSRILRRNPSWSLAAVGLAGLAFLLPRIVRPVEAELLSMVGSQGSGTPAVGLNALIPGHNLPRVTVFETDAWRHSLQDGSLEPVAQVPLPPAYSLWHTLSRRPPSTDLLRGAEFTADAYLQQIAALHQAYGRQRDILMYYGGIRRRPNTAGLNFNGWSGTDLRKLRTLGCRPFIGLETMDKADIRALIWRLKEAGYGPLDRIYVRIGAEPAYSAYGTEDGTVRGKRHTPAAYAAYRRGFARTAEYLNRMNRRHHLNIHTVFAGANGEDFRRYSPPSWQFDAIGYDLYVTPENKAATLRQLRELSRASPYKPMVFPEFGIATAGPARRWFTPRRHRADPAWATEALAEILEELGKRPGGVQAITVFSVNVSGRLSTRRWNWAWTPTMYAMLKEWQDAPRKWRRHGFHRYDPLSYPVGRDVLYLNRPDLRVVYRKLAAERSAGVPLFEETCIIIRDGQTRHRSRVVYFTGSEKHAYRAL
jgi:hypothetical protein